MSNVISAAHGASFNGAVRVQDAGVTGMITLRGDLSSTKMAKAVKAAVGLAEVIILPQTVQKDDVLTE